MFLIASIPGIQHDVPGSPKLEAENTILTSNITRASRVKKAVDYVTLIFDSSDFNKADNPDIVTSFACTPIVSAILTYAGQ